MKAYFWGILFLITFTLLGCAPGSQPESQPAEIQLPVRPKTEGPIFKRELLYSQDHRVSYCEILENNEATYSGFQDTQLAPLASLSKVITSAWAIQKLGIDYRFENEWFLQPVQGRPGVFDAYLRMNYDPIVNIEKLLFHLSELNKVGVASLRTLTIDETTRIYLSVLSQPSIELATVPVPVAYSKDNLNLILNSKNWAGQTRKAIENLKSWAARTNQSLKLPQSFSVEKVVIQNASQIDTTKFSSKKVIRSAPLFKYLKNLNVHSNNYIADALFDLLGGSQEFAEFQKNSLQIPNGDLQIYTGSGLADQSQGDRYDNLGSCYSMLKVLSYTKSVAKKNELNLGHILLNPSTDEDGTFQSSGSYNNAVVLKTGRLFENPAMNLAGFVATPRGLLSFVFLGHDFQASDSDEMQSMRENMLKHIFQNYPTSPQFLVSQDSEIFF